VRKSEVKRQLHRSDIEWNATGWQGTGFFRLRIGNSIWSLFTHQLTHVFHKMRGNSGPPEEPLACKEEIFLWIYLVCLFASLFVD